jgi:hypothetical protein
VGGVFCRSQRSMASRSYVYPVCVTTTGSRKSSWVIGHRRLSGGSARARPARRTAYRSPVTNPRRGASSRRPGGRGGRRAPRPSTLERADAAVPRRPRPRFVDGAATFRGEFVERRI